MAALAEERKKNIYAHLDPSHSFTPVAVETSGVVGPQSLAFLKDLGRRMRQVTGEERSLSYLRILQRVSVAVQRCNAASVLGTTGLAVRILPFFLSSLLLFFFYFYLSCFFFFLSYLCFFGVPMFCLFSPCLFTCAVVLVFLCLFPHSFYFFLFLGVVYFYLCIIFTFSCISLSLFF